MQSGRCSNIPFTFPNNNDREVELKATHPVFRIVHGAKEVEFCHIQIGTKQIIAISNTKLLLILEMKIPKDSLTPTMITEGAQRSKAQNIHTIYYYKGLIKPQAAHPYGKIDWVKHHQHVADSFLVFMWISLESPDL